MKKKIFIGFAALAVAAVAAWNVYLASAQSNELSELMLANLEALGADEAKPVWVQSAKTGTVQHDTGLYQIILGMRLPIYEDIKCCVLSVPTDACNSAAMDPDC
jgi:hypothetical protein